MPYVNRQRHRIGDLHGLEWHRTPSSALISLIRDLGPDLLVGPDHGPGTVEILPAPPDAFNAALRDFASDVGLEPGGPLLQSIGTAFSSHVDRLWDAPLILESPHDELRIVEAESADGTPLGVVALERRLGGYGARISGLFTGASLAVEKEMTGFGIGRALVMARLIVDERLPTWDLDTPAYSTGGEATVLSAARALMSMAPALEIPEP